MKCTKCGAECNDTMKFCIKCGNPIEPTQKKAAKNGGKRTAVLSAVLAGSLLLSGGAIAADHFIKQSGVSPAIHQGNTLINEKKYEEAVYNFDKALKLDPMNTDAYLGKAKALSAAGFYELADEVISEGIENCGAETKEAKKLTAYRTQLLTDKKEQEKAEAVTTEAAISETPVTDEVTEAVTTQATTSTAPEIITEETEAVTAEAPENNEAEDENTVTEETEIFQTPIIPVRKEYMKIDDYYADSYTVNDLKNGGYRSRIVKNGEVTEKSITVEKGDGADLLIERTTVLLPINDSVDDMYIAMFKENAEPLWNYTQYFYYDEWHKTTFTERFEGTGPAGGGSSCTNSYDEEGKLLASYMFSEIDGNELTVYEYDDYDNVISEIKYDLKTYYESDTEELLRSKEILWELTNPEYHWGGVRGSYYKKEENEKAYIVDTKDEGKCLYINDLQYGFDSFYPMSETYSVAYTYEYNSNGDILSCETIYDTRTERTDYIYDSEGRLIQDIFRRSDSYVVYIHNYGYDRNGTLVKEIEIASTITDDGSISLNATGKLRDGITDIEFESTVKNGLFSSLDITKSQYGFVISREEYSSKDSSDYSLLNDFVKGNAESIRIETDEYGLLTRIYKVDSSGAETDSISIDYIRDSDGKLQICACGAGGKTAIVKIIGGVTEYAEYSYDRNGNPISGVVYDKKTGEIISEMNATYCKKTEVFR